MAASLEVRALSKSYDSSKVLRDVEFMLKPLEHVILAGPSGGGKSTLLRIVAGLETPSGGEIRIDGVKVTEAGGTSVPAHQRGIGMVFQDLALWPNLSVSGNVELSLSAMGLSRASRRDRTAELLHACHLDCVARRRPETLSSGEQQRVALARTLAARPRILLLDEPFGALDRILREDLFDLVRHVCADYAVTALTVTHDLMDAWGLKADRVLVLEDGTIRDRVALSSLLEHKPMSNTLRAWQLLGRKIIAASDL